MQRTRAAIIGYGNVGRAAADALAASPDFELAGIVRRKVTSGKLLRGNGWTAPAVTNVSDLEGVQAALVCVPTRELEKVECSLLESGINVVDAFDIHGEAICAHREALQPSAILGRAVGVIASGWDPGIDSLIRALMEVTAPTGTTYTNFGPGMSMGHSVVARSVPGVADAISITLPAGRGRHKRAVYVVPDGSRPFKDIAEDITSDPCFAGDETEVFPVASVEPLADNEHAVRINREGVIGASSNQIFEWHMKICNPSATAQIMLGALRAALKSEPGVYTLLELPIAHMLPGSIGENIRRLI
ncbi:MAG: diaminopimelate dehydrogenase [Firmicutes bacterium]|jgi:diaminopimelate dehydrogenase|nr:diaminopimelate dehydrogenase [Bacillota bacterium]MDD4335833.1 diaminopimelate dehydrogenase [Bacillota bacterium]MDD4792052.1 diaminopimelate dehydrogenase [Bacillota bacterium]